MSQLELQLRPDWAHCPGHCGNCCTEKYAEHQATYRTHADAHLQGLLFWFSPPLEERMDLEGMDETTRRAEQHHHEWNRGLVLDELARRAAGGERERPAESIAKQRADRVPCVMGCGRRVHKGGTGVCFRCSLRQKRRGPHERLHRLPPQHDELAPPWRGH